MLRGEWQGQVFDGQSVIITPDTALQVVPFPGVDHRVPVKTLAHLSSHLISEPAVLTCSAIVPV